MSTQLQTLDEKKTSEVKAWAAPLVEGPISGKNAMPSKPPTAKQVQILQKEAYEEAYNSGRLEGMAKGYQEGMAKSQSKLNAQILTFQNLLTQFVSPLQELDDEIENNIVALTIQIARHLVRREMKAEPGEIVAVVREALSVLPVSALHPCIYLHPEDAELVRMSLSISEDDSNWRIMEDIALSKGDCRVETESSLVDASVDARLSSISAKILGGERDYDSGS